MANRDTRLRRWLSGPIGLLAGITALLVIHLVISLTWLGSIYLTSGSTAARSAYAQHGNPYNAAYEAGVNALSRALVPPARDGEAIAPHIRFEQPWNQGVALAIALAASALVIWLYRRETGAPGWYRGILASLRIALILLAMFMLSEAVLSVDRTGLPSFVVLIDDSASTSVADQFADADAERAAKALASNPEGTTEASRLAVARGWLADDDAVLLRELEKTHKLRIDLVSNAARTLAEIDQPADIDSALEQLAAVEPVGDQSRLGDGVKQILSELRGAPPTAILLLSDGQTTDGDSLPSAAEFARVKGVPLYTVGLGDAAPTRDLELADLMVDEVVFVEDQVRFQARLTGHGFEGEAVDIRLNRRPVGDDSDDSETAPGPVETVDQVTVTAPADGQSVPFEIRHRPEEVGDYVYSVAIEPRPRELLTDNNRIDRRVSVRDQKLKVLLVDGQPRYEFRYLLAFLKRDRTIDLRTVLQTADPEFSEQELTALPTFPTETEGPDGLFSYDVVLFGDVDPSFLGASQMRNLATFVQERGGGLMFIAGRSFNPLSYRGTPLEPLLPIKPAEARDPANSGPRVESFRPQLTAEGRNHPIFRFADDEILSAQIWESLRPMDWYLEAARKQELAFVLASHPNLNGSDGPLPILLYQYVGAGKVMLQAVDETWKWRFRVADLYFGRYWIQTIRFLARSKLLGEKAAELTTDRRRYRREQPIRIQVRFVNPGLAPASDTVDVQVERAGRGPRQLTLRRSAAATGLFEGVLPQAAEGNYEVRMLPPPLLEGGMPTARFQVDPPAGEFEQVRMNQPELIRAATISRGKFITPATSASALLSDLPAPKMVPLDTDPPIPLWNNPLVLVLFLALLIGEWVLRKRKQMA